MFLGVITLLWLATWSHFVPAKKQDSRSRPTHQQKLKKVSWLQGTSRKVDPLTRSSSLTTWNAKCPIFLGNFLPLKPATIALKIGHLAFQVRVVFQKSSKYLVRIGVWSPLALKNLLRRCESGSCPTDPHQGILED